MNTQLATPAVADAADALLQIIAMNRQHAQDQFGDAERAEGWGCVRVARAGLVAPGPASFQRRVGDWLIECFGHAIADDAAERNHRFVEEALELAQACGCTKQEALNLVDYVFGRPVGLKAQESGGVSVTHAALCRAQGIDMGAAAESELARVWTKLDLIREKQKSKPSMSPLPGVYPERSGAPTAPDSDGRCPKCGCEFEDPALITHDCPSGFKSC